MKRNIDMHTGFDAAKENILRGLAGGGGTNKSGLGRMAFPGYDFRRPQGAAFAVAKIARRMESDGLIQWDNRSFRGEYLGYSIVLTKKGEAEAAKLKGGAA